MLKSGWGETPYRKLCWIHLNRFSDQLTPMLACCVGHEIVGKAVKVGNNVKHVKVGDRGMLILDSILSMSHH
jgi:alcohol dehydrogenase (NADP+)